MKNKESAWSGKSRGGSFGYRFFIFLIRRGGVRTAYAFLAFVAVYFIPFAPKATGAIWRYNRRILKYGRIKSGIKLYRHYYTFGQTIIDKVAITHGGEDRFRFEFENYDRFLEVLNGGAAVIIGGHAGCWEIGSEFFGEYASRLNVVMFDGEYQQIKETVQAAGVVYKIIPVNEGGIESLLKIKQAIDRKEYVCFQGDRFLDSRNTFRVNFMGREALFPQGPFVLASKFSTPVIFYFAMREKGMRYRFIFRTIEPGAKKEEILNGYIKTFETVIGKYPQQWFNFYDVWQ